LLPLIDAIPPIRGLRGHPLQRPRVVYADRGYDSERHRRALRDRGIEPVIAKRRTEHGSGLGKYRWVVRTHAWLSLPSSPFVSSACRHSRRVRELGC
jgi:IS5 family transposase